MAHPFLRPSCGLRSRSEAALLTVAVRSVLASLFLILLLLPLRGRAIPAYRLRTFPTHLGVTRSHLWIMCFIHPLGSVSCACRLGDFAGVHFRLVSPHVSPVPLIPGFELVSGCSGFSSSCCLTCSRSLKITLSYVPRFVSSFSRSSSRTRSLTISYVPPFVSSFSRSSCCSLALAVR